MIDVLHISAHLGGGVGRVLSSVFKKRTSTNSIFKDRFICLEKPNKTHGLDVSVTNDFDSISREIDRCDILQIEWWNHPSMVKLLLNKSFKARTVIWSHTSGLHYPTIPVEWITSPNAFLFTCLASKCPQKHDNIVDVVNSSGGFDDIPEVNRVNDGHNLRYGYIGSLNKAKIHPHIEKYLDAVDDKFFNVDFWGDHTANPDLYLKSNRILMRRFANYPAGLLSCMDIFVYLLNPTHYGTTENALLEAMAASVVPVVLNNPVESNIVKHEVTGMVVDSPESFANAIKILCNDSNFRVDLSRRASIHVRQNYSLEATRWNLEKIYEKVLDQEPSLIDYNKIFGSTVEESFYSCAGEYKDIIWGDKANRIKHGVLYEDSKSSPYQFASYFPQSKEINCMVDILNEDKKGGCNV